MVFVAVLVSPFPSFFNETRYQLERSEQWYRPQLDLSRWMEDNLPPETGVLVSSIPEVWLKRQNPVLRVFSWWLLPDRARQGGREGFGAFLKKEGIRYVLWFEEDWTEAPTIAPFLGEGKDAEAGPVTLLSLDREDGYGWILYGVVPAGEKTTLRPPLFGSGERGVGWR